MDSKTLLNELIERTQRHMNEVQAFKELTKAQLNYKADAESWSVLECMEHLNRYGDYYLPEIRRRLDQSRHSRSSTFKTGLLGNYFAKSMLPKEKLNKMKTFQSMNPNNSKLDRSVLDKFLHQQETMLDLLNRAKEADLTKVKTSISISKLIKLRLGDTFRVVIYHNLRHIVQAKRVGFPQEASNPMG
jgi:hypothetical protein